MSRFAELKDGLLQAVDNFNGKKKEWQVQLRQEFSDLVKSFFDEHPEIESIGWTQYTPFFNDGDACYFRANIDASELLLNGERLYDLFEYNSAKYNETLQQLEEFSEILELVGDDTLETMFGDHAKVVLTRDGSTIKDYCHD